MLKIESGQNISESSTKKLRLENCGDKVHFSAASSSSSMAMPFVKAYPLMAIGSEKGASGSRAALLCFVDDLESSYFISGTCDVMVIKGYASLHGHVLVRGESIRVHAPAWDPAQRFQIVTSKDTKGDVAWKRGKKKKLSWQHALAERGLVLHAEDNTTLNDSKYNTIVLYKGVEVSDLEWMVAAEDMYRKFQEKRFKDLDTLVNVVSSVFGNERALHKAGLSTTSLPRSWITGVDTVAKRKVSSAHVPIKMLVCGAKGTGKSTLLRFSVNSLLNYFPSVAVIDCDLGQPELTPPGMVSLQVISEPIVTPSHLHLRDPEMAFFLGDVSAKQNPARLLSAIGALFNRYTKMQADMHDAYNAKVTAATNNNIFTAFDPDVTTKGRGDCIPLLINTDGWIRYTGAEILSAIVRMINPTDILHLSTPKDRTLDAFMELPEACALRTIEPGSSQPARASAVDLRSLRLISYFLGPSLKLKEIISSAYTLGKPIPISIKNGVLQDSSGAVAFALASSCAARVPLSQVTLSVPGDAIPRSHVLAAFNASLVGLGSYQVSNNQAGLQVEDGTELRPCLGLGIVRSISIPSGEMIVHARSSTQSVLRHDSGVFIYKGDILLPQQITCAPWSPTHPYCSGEMVGGTGAVMKSRGNLKRRAPQNNGT